MPRTQIRTNNIEDAGVLRDDLNITTAGQSVIRKIVQGTGISISSTGADSGTGDVTVNLGTNIGGLNLTNIGTIASKQITATDSVSSLFICTGTLTASAMTSLAVRAQTSNDMVDGFGAHISFRIQDNANIENEIANIFAVRNGADNTGRLSFYTVNAGSSGLRAYLDHSLFNIQSIGFGVNGTTVIDSSRNVNANTLIIGGSTLTATILSRLINVTSDVQTQLNGKANTTHNHDGAYCRYRGESATPPSSPYGGDIYTYQDIIYIYNAESNAWVPINT